MMYKQNGYKAFDCLSIKLKEKKQQQYDFRNIMITNIV